MRSARSILIAVGLIVAGASPLPAVEMLSLDQVRPGMVGVGRTVFEGTRVEEFKVTILGVLENIGPKQNLILGRLEGGRLAETGVIAGMSGSPVYIDGKLVGAVAYGFPFSKETIAGITPFAEMVEATRTEAPRPASTRLRPSFGPGGPPRPLDREALFRALKPASRTVPILAGGFRGDGLPAPYFARSLAPLSLPMVVSGFEAAGFEAMKPLLDGLGFTPVFGGGGRSGLPDTPLPDLVAGGTVGVSLLEGDFDMSVTGTVTHIDGDRVYAFGHPFYNLGPTQFPMKKAWVFAIFPSLYSSFKIATSLDPVGTIEQDRITGVAGRIGQTPRMIPVDVKIATSRGLERRFSYRIVDDELFSPLLTYASLISVLQATERAFGTSTMRVDARVALSGGREVRLDDLFTQEQPAVQASALVAAPLAYLMSNDLERVAVEKVSVDLTSQETIQTAVIERAWISRSGPIRPGSITALKVLLRTYRGEASTQLIPVSIPATVRPGSYSLQVCDAAALDAVEQREMRQPFVPRSIDQLIRAINGLRRNNHVYARLTRPDDGAIVSGEYMQSLPPSVLSVLGAVEQKGGVVPLRNAAVWDFDLATDYAVTGSHTLSLNVER